VLTVQNYIDSLKNGKILGSKCKKCGNRMIPLKPVCSKCGSFDVEEFETKGKGIIRSFTIIFVAPEKFKDEVPYDPYRSEDIVIGTKVKFEVLAKDEEIITAFKIDK